MTLVKNLSKKQLILNNCIYKQDLTINLSINKNRYIVSTKNIYTGTNPSNDYSSLLEGISSCIKEGVFDSIGGWKDDETGMYYLDANIHVDSWSFALNIARNNNQIAIYDTVEQKTIAI